MIAEALEANLSTGRQQSGSPLSHAVQTHMKSSILRAAWATRTKLVMGEQPLRRLHEESEKHASGHDAIWIWARDTISKANHISASLNNPPLYSLPQRYQTRVSAHATFG